MILKPRIQKESENQQYTKITLIYGLLNFHVHNSLFLKMHIVWEKCLHYKW